MSHAVTILNGNRCTAGGVDLAAAGTGNARGDRDSQTMVASCDSERKAAGLSAPPPGALANVLDWKLLPDICACSQTSCTQPLLPAYCMHAFGYAHEHEQSPPGKFPQSLRRERVQNRTLAYRFNITGGSYDSIYPAVRALRGGGLTRRRGRPAAGPRLAPVALADLGEQRGGLRHARPPKAVVLQARRRQLAEGGQLSVRHLPQALVQHLQQQRQRHKRITNEAWGLQVESFWRGGYVGSCISGPDGLAGVTDKRHKNLGAKYGWRVRWHICCRVQRSEGADATCLYV